MAASWPFLLVVGLVAVVGVTLLLRRCDSSTPLARRRRWGTAAYWMWVCTTAFFVFYEQPAAKDDLILHLTFSPLNVAANVLLFLPAGAVPVLARLRWVAWAVPIAVVGSILIEVVQYVADLGRTADLNDVLANGLGAALGAGLAVGALRLAGPPGSSPRVRRESEPRRTAD